MQPRLRTKLGCNIPINVVKQGLRIDHWEVLAISGDVEWVKKLYIWWRNKKLLLVSLLALILVVTKDIFG